MGFAVFAHYKGGYIELSSLLGVAQGIRRNNIPTKAFDEGIRVSLKQGEAMWSAYKSGA